MSRKLPLAGGGIVRTACARGVLRTGVEEKTGELLSAAVLAERVGWAADLVSGMVAVLLAEHWNAADVDVLAAGEDTGAARCRRTPGWPCAAWAGRSARPGASGSMTASCASPRRRPGARCVRRSGAPT
ncbi:hypothetical protein [Streptomyces canus]|uniref:hypothetical protein n=1 Tax=Streptomyces canus TaxID=58343 RepID=UPI002E25C0D1